MKLTWDNTRIHISKAYMKSHLQVHNNFDETIEYDLQNLKQIWVKLLDPINQNVNQLFVKLLDPMMR